MSTVFVRRDRCKSCGLCIAHCPPKIIGLSEAVNKQGSHFAEVRDPARCIACMICAITCPELAIHIHVNAVQYQCFDYFSEEPA